MTENFSEATSFTTVVKTWLKPIIFGSKQVGENGSTKEIRIYKKRWLILAIFCVLSMSNSFQWIEHSIVADVLVEYYGVSSVAIDWTSLIYMAVYIPLVFPATWLLDAYGLRLTTLIGAFINCVGAWLKCAATSPEHFIAMFTGQTLCAIAQVFILGVPARLAAVWFGSKEVSTACALGVFGNQVGIAVGFVLPPIIVRKNATIEEVEAGLRELFFGVATITSVIFLLVLFAFTSRPPHPPSSAELAAFSHAHYFASLKKLSRNLNFCLLLITYGINVGAFYAISTLLNQMILVYYPGEQENAGRIGLLIVLAGMVGSLVIGVWLDRTHKYRLTICVVYALSFVGVLINTFTVGLGYLWLVFVVCGFLGFFMTGYLPLGFEFAAELTYPLPEGTTSGLLNCSAQVFGIITTSVLAHLLKIHSSAFTCNVTLSVVLLVGTIVTAFIKEDLRRQRATDETSSISRITGGTVEHDYNTFCTRC